MRVRVSKTRGAENTSTCLRIVNIMDLIENDEFDISDEVRSLVKHTSENLCGHNQTIRLRVDLDIPGQDPDGVRTEGLLEVPEFLVGKSLDW